MFTLRGVYTTAPTSKWCTVDLAGVFQLVSAFMCALSLRVPWRDSIWKCSPVEFRVTRGWLKAGRMLRRRDTNVALHPCRTKSPMGFRSSMVAHDVLYSGTRLAIQLPLVLDAANCSFRLQALNSETQGAHAKSRSSRSLAVELL